MNRRMFSLAATALLAVLFTDLTHLTGLSSEEAIFLQIGNADVSLQGLLCVIDPLRLRYRLQADRYE